MADEDALMVFAAVVEATATGSPQHNGNTISVTWTTVRGVSRRTGLPDATVVSALERLTEAHLMRRAPRATAGIPTSAA
ncbi:MAG: hypothetical protein M3401_14025 [Actinomycetota bacterium]|nr:hypothetical protein [Actinomycetota bacterium]